MAVSGRPLSPEIKSVIVTLKNYFDRNKKVELGKYASAQLTADALELSRVSVDRVMKEYRKNWGVTNFAKSSKMMQFCMSKYLPLSEVILDRFPEEKQG